MLRLLEERLGGGDAVRPGDVGLGGRSDGTGDLRAELRGVSDDQDVLGHFATSPSDPFDSRSRGPGRRSRTRVICVRVTRVVRRLLAPGSRVGREGGQR